MNEFPAETWEYTTGLEYGQETEWEIRRRKAATRYRPQGRPPARPRPTLVPRPRPGPALVYRRPPGEPLEPPSRQAPGGGPAPAEPAAPAGHEYVRWVQSTLNHVLGLQLPLDGVMGPETRSALCDFQRRWRLPADGFVGPDTERALLSARRGRPPARAEREMLEASYGAGELEAEVKQRSPDYIRWVQSSLNQIMGLRLAVDGIMGPATRSAIRSFQQRHGLAVDGIVGPQTEATIKAVLLGVSPTPAPPQATAGHPDIVSVRGIRVARQIAPQVEALLTAAEADRIRLSGGGWRSRETQIELRRRHCGPTHYDIYERPSSQCTPPTARPGHSMHEQGLAIDFRHNGQLIRSRANPAFRWLSRNAARFGLYNLPREPWHWSVNGR